MKYFRLGLIILMALGVGGMLMPVTALAQGFSLSPPSVTISGLPPGGETQQFPMTITNKEDTAYTFQLTVYNPPDKDLKEGFSQLPDNSWIAFSSNSIEVPPNSSAEVTVMVTVPEGQQWANKNYEVWLGVSPEAAGLFAIKLYSRLYLVTASPVAAAGTNWGLICSIALAAVIVILCGDYYIRRKLSKKK
jgi:hypothetical protein